MVDSLKGFPQGALQQSYQGGSQFKIGFRSSALTGRHSALPTTTAASVVNQPQFGNSFLQGIGQKFLSKSTNTLLPVFENITEVFLWGFLAQDVLSMWLPRIRQSLVRGAIEYDPTKDEDNKGLTPFQLAKKTILTRVKGWNWVNFNEETKREFATGPGVLFIPTLAYSIARRTLGKTSVELGYGPMTQMTDTFIHHLKNSPLGKAEKVTPEQFKGELKKYLNGLFHFEESALKTEIEVLSTAGTKTKTTLADFLTQWSNRYVDTIFAKKDLPGKEMVAALENLEKEFSRGVVDAYNRKHLASTLLHEIDKVPLKVMERVKNAETGKVELAVESTHRAAGEFMHELNRWKDFALTVFDQKVTGGKLRQGLGDALPELAEKIYKKLVTKKAIFAVGVSALTGWYLVKLAKWAQSHETYEANRLLQETPAQPSQKAPAAKQRPALPMESAPDAQNIQDLLAQLAAQAPAEVAAPISTPAPIATAPQAQTQSQDWTTQVSVPSTPAISSPVYAYAAPGFLNSSYSNLSSYSPSNFSNPYNVGAFGAAYYPSPAVQPGYFAPQYAIGMPQAGGYNNFGYYYGGAA